MSTTPFLGITELASDSQAGAAITVNDATRALEYFTQCGVKDRDLLTPPGSPADGDAYMMPAAGTLLLGWSGFSNKDLVLYLSGAWVRFSPKNRMLVWVDDEKRYLRYNSSATWVEAIVQKAKIIVINPTGAENIALDFIKRASTIRRINYAIKGTSCTFNIVQGSNRGTAATNVLTAAITATTTAGLESTAFASSGALTAANWLVLTTSAVTACTELDVVIEYTED